MRGKQYGHNRIEKYGEKTGTPILLPISININAESNSAQFLYNSRAIPWAEEW